MRLNKNENSKGGCQKSHFCPIYITRYYLHVTYYMDPVSRLKKIKKKWTPANANAKQNLPEYSVIFPDSANEPLYAAPPAFLRASWLSFFHRMPRPISVAMPVQATHMAKTTLMPAM